MIAAIIYLILAFGLSVIGFWLVSGMILRRKVEFDSVNRYGQEEIAKFQQSMLELQQSNSRFAMDTAVRTSESMAKILIETIPKSIELTVRGIFSEYRIDDEQRAKLTQEHYARLQKEAGDVAGEQDWWNTSDEDAVDPFDEYTNLEDATEPYAPSPQREEIRSRNAARG